MGLKRAAWRRQRRRFPCGRLVKRSGHRFVFGCVFWVVFTGYFWSMLEPTGFSPHSRLRKRLWVCLHIHCCTLRCDFGFSPVQSSHRIKEIGDRSWTFRTECFCVTNFNQLDRREATNCLYRRASRLWAHMYVLKGIYCVLQRCELFWWIILRVLSALNIYFDGFSGVLVCFWQTETTGGLLSFALFWWMDSSTGQ